MKHRLLRWRPSYKQTVKDKSTPYLLLMIHQVLAPKLLAEQAGRDKEMFIVGVDGSPDAVTTLKENKSYVGAQHKIRLI